MAWQTECVRILRHLINDLDDDAPTFSSSRLQETILVAATMVLREASFSQTYAVDVDALSMTPDPTLSTNRDDSFIALVCLKAGCIIDRARLRSNVGQGIKIRDGDSEVDTTASFKGHEILLKEGNCAEYNRLKFEYLAGNSVAGQAILGPYRIYNESYISRNHSNSTFN